MTKQQAIKLIWDYMHLNHVLKKADVILVLGSTDTTTAKRAAQLWLDGWAPYVLCSGSGSVHSENPAWKKFVGSTEADVFAEIIKEAGVPKEFILIENKSQNTGQNFEFSADLLKEKGVDFETVIVVQKPTIERRIYATGKVWWSDVELIITSPQVTVEEYTEVRKEDNEYWIHVLAGDLQRIKEYPAKGFQIEQDIPDDVWEAYETLVSLGYTDYLIK